MPVHLMITREGQDLEFDVCCAGHARVFALDRFGGHWWEVFDGAGDMVDSADLANEETLERGEGDGCS